MQERDIEKRLREGIEEMGGRAWKWLSPGNSGVPDRVITIAGRTIFIELKTKTGKLSQIQKVQIRRLKACKADVRVLYGLEDVEAFLKEVGADAVRPVRISDEVYQPDPE